MSSLSYRRFIGLLSLLILLTYAPTTAAEPELEIQGWLNFEANEDTNSFILYNGGDGLLEWSITSDQPWLTVDPTSGTNTVGGDRYTRVWGYVDRSGLADGVYFAELQITSNGGERTLNAWMIVQVAPQLQVYSGTVGLSLGQTTNRFIMYNRGLEPLTWSASSNQPWIDLVPPLSGTLAYGDWDHVNLALDVAALPSQNEEHFGSVTVTSNGGNADVTVHYVPPSVSPGVLGLYLDGAGTNCNITYASPGLVTVIVVHTHTDGATAAQFSAPKPACWTDATFLSDTDVFPVTIGSSQTGKAVGYGACVSAPIWVTAINYFASDPLGAPCCLYPVLPDPNIPSGEIEIVDCANIVHSANGTYAIVHPDATCMCSGVVKVEETTWGRVKALYASPPDE